MFTIKTCLAYYIFLNMFCHIHALVPLPIVEDCDIVKTEKTVRNTIKSIFKAFEVRGISKRPRIKQFSAIHNLFVTITLKDCDNHLEIARLSRVNITDNNTRNFIAEINNILNAGAGDKSNEETDNNIYVSTHIHKFINKLKYLQESYASYKDSDINTKILQFIELDRKTLDNVTKVSINKRQKQESEEFDEILNDDDVWHMSGRRIYEGTRTFIRKFPFMASIHFFNKFQCAGSIIQNDLVITSSSCLQIAWNNRFFRENPAFLSVRVGCAYYDLCGESIPVLEIYFHPQYDPETLKHNIAIMRLNRKINFRRSNGKIKKIEVDQNPWSLPMTCSITVIGWGAKDSRNIVSDIYKNKLSYAKLDVFLLKDCQEHYSKDFVTNRHFCAGYVTKGSGACNRDAGGPGLYESTLMGVISFGSPICGAPDSPTVFTKLGFYWNWIENIMDMDYLTYGLDTTTLPPTTFPTIPTQSTTEELKIIPLWGVKATTTANESNLLRIPQEESFSDFMSSVFEIKDLKLDTTEIGSKEKGEPYVNVSEEQKITAEVDSSNEEQHVTATETVKYTILESPPTDKMSTTEEDESDDDEIGLNIEYINETTLHSDAEVPEKDIMALIDDLDMDEIIRSIIPEEAEINQHGDTKKPTEDLVKPRNLSIETSSGKVTIGKLDNTEESILSIEAHRYKTSKYTKSSTVKHKPPNILFNVNDKKKKHHYLL